VSSIALGGSSASAGFDMRPSVPPIHGNLLDVKRFTTFSMFLPLLSGFFAAGCSIATSQLLYYLSL
jgi:hypothetical protein